MAKMSCFATLLSGRRKKHHRKVADATKVGCKDCPKVKPQVDAPVAAADDTVLPVALAAAHKEGDQHGEKASMKGELESHAAKKTVGSHDGGAEKGASPEQGTAASPRLKRSCSNMETKRRDDATPAQLLSHGDLTRGPPEEKASPASANTSRSADRVTLKRRSSSQVLPSRSRKLWWRLFVWSLHRDRHGGYASDTHEAEGREVDDCSPPPNTNQWVAFCADSNSSLLDRVGAWVNSIENEPFRIPDGADTVPPGVFEVGEPSSGKGRLGGKYKRGAAAADEVVLQANSAAFSSVAHISGMGLKAMPVLAPFSSLRAVDLSGNFIVHIAPGSLPKGLHSIDLSRNKIATVEGLRDLTKLRVLNLSYNRISRIGHGLSNCTAIRELYLAGNKLSDVEGLHRLLKLAVLDLSFNKITTSKALGQLVANYHSLLALNLVGNPVQANVGDDPLRRAVTGLLPSLAYLNKQPVKPQREVPTDSVVARAAFGGGRSQCSRRASRRLASGSGDRTGSRSRSKSRARAR